MRVRFCGLELRNPIIAASGTFGYGSEFEEILSLDKIGGFRTDPITVEEVAGAVAATVDQGNRAPFRIPVGAPAQAILAARKAAPEDAPFLAAPLDW